MIHVCFCLHDKTGHYAKFTGTAMLSLFENTNSNITVHILHDNTLSTDNRDKFIYVAGQCGQTVKFYNVEELCADKLAEFLRLIPAIKTSFSTIGTFFKLLIPQVLPADIDKCIYLDSDMLVNLDIKELWQIDLREKPLAAVPEMEANYHAYKEFEAARKYLLSEHIVNYDDYFNAGLIVMNLEYLHNNKDLILSGVKWRGDHPQCNCFDQDIWNYLFSKNYVKLPVKYDGFVASERLREKDKQVLKSIHHFSGSSLQSDMSDQYNRLWMDYFMKTPWFDTEAMGRLYSGFQQIHVGLKQSMINVSAIMSGKTRAFFAPSANVDALKKIFSIRDDEEIIPAENNESLKKLIDAMNASRGKKIFFIMIPFPFQILIQAGFEPGKDFVNGLEFLSEAHGVPLNSYELIKAL